MPRAADFPEHILPLEFSVARLRAPREKEEPPNIRINSSEPCRVTKDTNIPRFAKFTTLVIQVFSR
ncbi:hypothetical protein RRF57_009317 [Xylaria bambusicola]|uniref:Uncharacterized protein n=1 Tax=Xylaria bambusicola TaxID=326684 RepID=A0AAN7UUS1_9PEZI